MEYKIIEELGRGMFGTVYKIKYKDKYFAMKIEHVLEEDKEKNIKSNIWREIDFMTKFAKKYKDQIMQMYHYDFIDSCDHEQKFSVNLKNFEKYHRYKFIKLNKSKTCIRRIYELIDGNVKDIIPKLSTQQIYSFIVQVAIIVKIFEKNKYIHGDFHSANIGYIKTDKKFIKYGKIKIPTFGYIFKAIDLGSVMNPKYKLSKREKIWYKDLFKRELISPLGTSLINSTKYWDYIDDNNHHRFRIDSWGNFIITHKINGVWQDVDDWKSHSAIKYGRRNQLEIKIEQSNLNDIVFLSFYVFTSTSKCNIINLIILSNEKLQTTFRNRTRDYFFTSIFGTHS